MKELAYGYFPNAERIRVVMDNLNTHNPAALYEAFEPQEARRLLNELELHYTPKHGRWLNRAEIEFNALFRQSLDRRTPDAETLASKVAAWETDRNTKQTTANWRFTTDDARVKPSRLYPSLDDWHSTSAAHAGHTLPSLNNGCVPQDTPGRNPGASPRTAC